MGPEPEDTFTRGVSAIDRIMRRGGGGGGGGYTISPTTGFTVWERV